MLFSLEGLTMQFGGLTAVNNFSCQVDDMQLKAIIGPNGAGKTTIFNMVTGVYRPTSGKFLLDGHDITHLLPHKIAQMGMARTFQNIRLFKNLSVIDNLKVAMHAKSHYSLVSGLLRSKTFYREEERIHQACLDLLKIFKLDKDADLMASGLPYGQQRKLEIARAMALRPKILLLDEPAAGMNPQETKEIGLLIKWIRDEFKIAILLIEHDMKLVMSICEEIYVVDSGELLAVGSPHEIQNNPAVIRAYLGAEIE